MGSNIRRCTEIRFPNLSYFYTIIACNMPYKERDINKLYFTMGEVTEMFDVNASQIRFYEREFEILQPKKNKKGNRLFTPDDVENLKIIFNLVKEKGFTLQGAKDYIRNNKGEVKENQKVIDSLEKLKQFLLEVKEQL
jgi:DNA-binding transcriptional MerR regulator